MSVAQGLGSLPPLALQLDVLYYGIEAEDNRNRGAAASVRSGRLRESVISRGE